MKFNLIFYAVFFMTFKTVFTEKYPYIDSCYYYDDIASECNVTFVCSEIVPVKTFLQDESNICLNQHLYPDYESGYFASWIGTVNFDKCVLTEIPSDLFKFYYNVHTLNISDIGLQLFQYSDFDEAINLRKLDASRNEIVEIPPFLFYKTDQLTEIDLSLNKIRVIDDLGFFGNFSLSKLNLSHNELTRMDKHILEDHLNLTHLDLSNNRIQNLVVDVFESWTRLVLLDLSNNLIHNFNNKTFVNLVNLNYLNLSSNHLSEIQTGSFATLFHLEVLDLSNNELKTLNVNILPSRLVRNLNWFSIANNQLRELTGFTSSRIPNIRIIGVDSNKFSCWYLKHELFKSMTWENLYSVSNRIDCNTANSGAKPIEEADVTTEAIQRLTSVFNGPEKVLHEIIQVNHQGMNSSQKLANYEHLNDGKNTNIPLISCIFIILGLVIIVAVLITFLLRKREYRAHHADVLYRRNEMTSADAVENQHYDIVFNK